MTEQEIFEKMKRQFVRIIPDAPVDTITMETRLSEDLGLNSMNLMLLALMMEDAFGIQFDSAADFTTVGGACAYAARKIGGEKA